MANKYLEKLAGMHDLKHLGQAAWELTKKNPLTVGLGVGGAVDKGMSTTKKKNESDFKFGLRAVRNTLTGAAYGAAAGKGLELGYQILRNKAGRNY